MTDVFDALTSDRVYRDAWSLEKTLELLNHDKGSHFDPPIVELFLESMDEVLRIRKRYADQSAAATSGKRLKRGES